MQIALLTKAAFLGIIQGLGEFLPISSTGHLIIFEKLLHFSQSDFGLTFDVALHLGTLLALLCFFKRDLLRLISGSMEAIKSKTANNESKLTILLIIATIPGGLFGILLEKKVETIFRSPVLVAISLILFSFVIVIAEKVAKQTKEMLKMKPGGAFLIGLFQALALIPGVSRSGASIVGGLLLKLKEEEAARFSFLLSIPIILGAGLKKFLEIKNFSNYVSEAPYFSIGFLFAAITGFLAIKYFLEFLKKHGLTGFVIYRILMGTFVLILSFFGKM